MNLEEAINSDDIEIAELAANMLLKKLTSKKIENLLKKNDKYDYDYVDNYFYLKEKLINLFNKRMKLVNMPLLSITEIKSETIYINEDADTITFDVSYKIDEK